MGPYHLHFDNSSRNELVLSLNFTTKEPEQVYEFFAKSNESAEDQDTILSFCFDHVRIPRLRIPSGDTSSEAAFETLKSWITRCQEEHTLCRRPVHNMLPRRVLEIDSIEPLRVRLVEDGARREGLLDDDYACLSHRWGPKTESNSLKGSNLGLYKTGVPESKFGPLIRDAIIAIFRLGLRLVWIDCFCIIQDSIEDWELEAANMGRIYENAFLTIAASPDQENYGMFSTLSKEFEAFQVMEIEGESIYIRRKLPHPLRRIFRAVCPQDPLLKRGWVFQERWLSNRFIHFTGNEIFWECREGIWCECLSENIMWAEQLEKVGNSRTICKRGWNFIIQEYIGTDLSFEEDKLPAIAGIARRYAKLCGGWTYLSGLWKEDLPSALKWRKHWYGARDPRPLVQVAPTWSWACLPHGDNIWTWRIKGHIPLVKHTISPPGADVYAGARSAEITVEAPTLDVQVYRESPGELIGKHQNGFFLIWADFKPDPDDETKFRAIPNDSSCLLLLLYPDEDEEELAHDDVHGIVLMQQNSRVDADGKDVKFERIGLLNTGGDVYVDDGYAEHYRGGPFPWLVDRDIIDDDQAGYTFHWLVKRAKKRRVTLV
ncbi:hypothetical protein SLS63_002695 [Diaporthe eres]|uniref:Heterokaryon incompatibility domain-containing protein n=1 Tax=Diaporthe eres TaxID=83184 RepID=A0ABR1PIL3_DIAER